ncbi:MAG: hypothetical protein IKK39_08465, partial [Thermoguttaceae bacterium]|nr:hypothetical protein [Thermoguttaceae bacterium]
RVVVKIDKLLGGLGRFGHIFASTFLVSSSVSPSLAAGPFFPSNKIDVAVLFDVGAGRVSLRFFTFRRFPTVRGEASAFRYYTRNFPFG